MRIIIIIIIIITAITNRTAAVDGRAVAVRPVVARPVVVDRVAVPWKAPMSLPPACSFPVIRRDTPRVR
jgi:hypothetical protein